MTASRSATARALALAFTVLTLVPAVRQIWTLLSALRARFFFPLDHEWMESGHLYHAYRLLHGLPLYSDPARGFATFPYPPLYWVALAGSGAAFGLDYTTGRALSLACFAGTATVLAVTIIRHAPTRWLGAALALAALGGIAASYPLVGASYDLARSDSMALFFPVLAAALLPDAPLARGRALAVGLALTATLYTKQTGIFFVVWLLGFALVHDRRSGARLILFTAVPCAVLLAALCAVTGGWFWTWIFDMAGHGLRSRPEWSHALGDFLLHAPFVVAIPWLVAELYRRRALSPTAAKWAGMLAAAFAASMLPYMKTGGWLNVLGPFFVLSWPTTIVLACDLARANGTRSASSRALLWSALAITGMVSWLMRWDPAGYAPLARDWTNAAKIRAIVRDLDGQVVVTHVPFLAAREGKTCEQPNFQGFIDAENAGMHVGFVDALDRSGATYLIVASWPDPVHDFQGQLPPRFERVRELDFTLRALYPCSLSIWRRTR